MSRKCGRQGPDLELPGALLTVREVASILRVNYRDVYALANRGELPCVRIGRRVRFLPGDIARWVEARRY
ncbi:MAG: helix-turn-helix domain-containing protein [Candidatus Eisenbacteria bacterium]